MHLGYFNVIPAVNPNHKFAGQEFPFIPIMAYYFVSQYFVMFS